MTTICEILASTTRPEVLEVFCRPVNEPEEV